MKNIFVINGTAESGKDTFVEYMGEFLNVKNVSSVDKLKEAAMILGWDGKKKDKDRKFLSDMKLLSIDYNDHPYRYIQSQINSFHEDDNQVMFIHIREPAEISRVVNRYGASTIIVKNQRIQNNSSNSSDFNVDDYKYDYVLKNNGTLEELKAKAKGFAEYLIDINRISEKE